MDDAQKLDVLCRINEEIKAMPPEQAMRESCRSFNVSTLAPIMACLAKHFNNDRARFLEKHPNFKHSSFKTQRCNGTKDECNAKNRPNTDN